MEEGQIKDLIAQLTVRVKVKEDDKDINEKGTGVLLLQDSKAYVLTVYHCIYGKKEPFHTAIKESITFSFLPEVCAEIISPIYIIPLKQNLVLMEIDITKLDKTDMKCHYLEKAYDGKQYYLRGFPKSEVHNFKATCNDENFNEVTFKLDVNRLTDDTSGEKAVNFIAGLSGGGVFFSENNQLYLVGLANELRDKNGVFNTVHCTKLIDLIDKIKFSERLVFKNYNKNIEITESENLRYINQLKKSYNSDATHEIKTLSDIENSEYKRHFKTARKSFRMVEDLRQLSRDNLPEGTYEEFQEDMCEGIINTVESTYKNAFFKVKATEDRSINFIVNSYPSFEGKQCRPIERKGVCHQLVNDEEISWIKDE